MAKRIFTASQALPFRLHLIEDSADCRQCGAPAQTMVEPDEDREQRIPMCLACMTAIALVCPAGNPQGASGMPRTIQSGCILRDRVGNRPVRYSPRCTDEVAVVVIGQGADRHYRVRSEPLCARHAEMVEDEVGITDDGGIRLGMLPVQRPQS